MTEEYGYRGGYIPIGSTEVFDVTIWATSSLEEEESFGLALDRFQLSKRVMPAVSSDDSNGPSHVPILLQSASQPNPHPSRLHRSS